MKFTSKIISKEIHSSDYHLLKIERPISFVANPGQFALVLIPGFPLRRPLSFFEINDNEIIFFYKPNGIGLKSLAQLDIGAFLTFYGPYGKELPQNQISLFSHFDLHPALHYLAKKNDIHIQSMDKIQTQDNIIVAAELNSMLSDDRISPKALLFCQETMGCGVGACMSCVIHTKKGETIKICQEGPFIRKEELI
jgi:dihydroorotate dehydrogenase electron transfer subunit